MTVDKVEVFGVPGDLLELGPLNRYESMNGERIPQDMVSADVVESWALGDN